MFLGHFAVGLAAKPLAPRLSLPILLAAPQVLDMAWPVFVGTGVERARIEPGHLEASALVLESMPYSHSLVAALGWALLCALAYTLLTRANPDRRGALVVAALVLSHWVLDWASHEPDMQLVPGGARYGLGLWYSLPATLATELAMFAVGVGLYTRATTATGRWGRIGWPVMVALLVAGFFAALLGKPPPDIEALVISAFVLIAVIIGVGVAIDRQRPLRAA